MRIMDWGSDVCSSGLVLSIIGTSGCGKSTLLNVVGGPEEPSDGVVLVDGRPIEGPGRDRGFVFQSYSLFEWMTVERNIDFALETSTLGKAERREQLGRASCRERVCQSV